jgi:MerR family transcriptional regulator, light-induced transcriptional regulator
MMADFGTRLKELRRRRGLTQKDLGAAFGLSQATIANYEQRLRFPDEPLLGRLADFFSVTLDQLMGRDGERAAAAPSGAVEQPAEAPEAALQFLEAVRDGGLEAGREVIRAASRTGMSVRDIDLRLFQPALEEAGRLWARGLLSVGEEHMISQATESLMSWVLPDPGPVDSRPREPLCLVLAACGEQHLIGARMVRDFLLMDGWDARFLGGDLGIRHVREAVARHRPRLIAISVTMPHHLPQAADLIASLKEARTGAPLPVLAGGRAFIASPTLWRDIGADGTARDAAEAVEMAHRLAGGAGPRPTAEPPVTGTG